MNREFKGVWIPKEIWTNSELTLQEKMLLVEIQSFEQCFASNAHFAEFLGLGERRIKDILSSLRDKGFITSTEERKGNHTVKRTIFVDKAKYYGVGEGSCTGSGSILPEVGEGSCTRTNTVTNTTTKIKEKSEQSPDNSKYKYTPDQLEFAETMVADIRLINPSFKQPNIEKWANEIRLMVERDQLSHADVERVWKWANRDSFWQSNILSPTKLRKQFDRLSMQMNRATPRPQQSQSVFAQLVQQSPVGLVDGEQQINFLESDHE